MPFFFRRYLKNRQHKHFIDHLAQVNSVISAIALFPQLLSLVQGASPEGLSLVSFSLIALNSCVWFVYGVHRQTPPLIISSLFNGVASMGILIIIAYR